jgi:hypothetical protein
MTSKTAILPATVASLFVLTTTAFAADESNRSTRVAPRRTSRPMNSRQE